MTTPRPDLTAARDALLAEVIKAHAYNTGVPFQQRHVDWLLHNSPAARALARAEAGVSKSDPEEVE